jgi:ABC-type nickel/cobalt efflux system permease component RcnA
LLFVALGALILVGLPLVALAHPLGNFTINQFVGLHVTTQEVDVDYVVDMAEIPAFQEQQVIDADGDGKISPAEQAGYQTSACADRAEGLNISVDGSPVTMAGTTARLSFPPGQAGLSTLRLECGYRFEAAGAQLAVENNNFSERIGWREITVTSDGVEVSSDLPSESASARLTSYPQDPSAASPDLRRGSVEIGGFGGFGDTTVAAAPPTGLPIDALGSLISKGTPGTGTGVVALLAALALGAAHALAPGHGKTIMSAYLVANRGTIRQALGMGLAVAVSHTVGVLALGVATLLATRNFQPERIYPYLSAISGTIVLVIGVVLLVRSVRSWRHTPAHAHGHDHHHDHDHHHHHHHESPGLELSLGWKTFTALGLSGGLIPSASAVVLLLGAIHLGKIEFGLALIGAFGLGMAAAMVTVGLGLVAMTRFGLTRLSGKGWSLRLAAIVPPVMGLFVTGAGLIMMTSAGRNLIGV